MQGYQYEVMATRWACGPLEFVKGHKITLREGDPLIATFRAEPRVFKEITVEVPENWPLSAKPKADESDDKKGGAENGTEAQPLGPDPSSIVNRDKEIPVTRVAGIGDAFSQRLIDSGLFTAQQIVADPDVIEKLTQISGIGDARAAGILESCREAIAEAEAEAAAGTSDDNDGK